MGDEVNMAVHRDATERGFLKTGINLLEANSMAVTMQVIVTGAVKQPRIFGCQIENKMAMIINR